MDKLDQRQNALRAMESVAVAYSGGIDSTFLLKIAHDVLGTSAVAITADSPSLPRDDLREAKAIAAQLGVEHICIPISEMSDARYLHNSPDRCHFCKTHTYDALTAWVQVHSFRSARHHRRGRVEGNGD